MKYVSILAVCLLLAASFASGQITPRALKLQQWFPLTQQGKNEIRTPQTFVKQPGLYTTVQWRALIDSTWGPGEPTATKLQYFDRYWYAVDSCYGGFFNLQLNWDSLRTLFRPEIAAGVSRGRFAGIMTQLSLALQETHSWSLDWGVDSLIQDTLGNLAYRAGIPLLFLGQWGWNHFGAALSPLPDSSLLVIRVMQNHPLGIKAGDVILGYNRTPWKKLYRDLLAAQLPLSTWSPYWGSSDRSMTYTYLTSAGLNWGLFDSIDIVHYTGGDTVHLPTNLLAGLSRNSLYVTDQIPVNGVPMPYGNGGTMATYGIVAGTTIGYIHMYLSLIHI